ncbi:hypothetical protein C3F09_06965 [candidate division GN15 bacterium]|uniref:DUF2007 domain-containing protein n=1 Tax=candidate division GN15 bacterium TaxID=2072418 RepID=A0A855X2H1_9BACT|nr:MAG: hypothetical protein C3F09_06965 [candidate division GN15 bacterium]
MFCPQCRYEYRPEVSKCPDCDVWLVKELPVEPKPEIDEESAETSLEVVYSTYEYSRITLAAAILQEAGISNYIADQPVHGILRAPTPGRDPFELVVRADDLDRAAELLEGIDEATDLPEDHSGPDEPPSPSDEHSRE